MEYIVNLLKLPIEHMYFSSVLVKNWIIMAEDLYKDPVYGKIVHKYIEMIYKSYLPKVEKMFTESNRPKWFFGETDEFYNNFLV